jgi:hypothetical protein
MTIDEEIIRGKHIDDFREQSDIAQRFREEAGLTGEELQKCLPSGIDFPVEDGEIDYTKPRFSHLGVRDIHRDIANAQLNKAFSTKLDNRYRLALIDTKGELPSLHQPNFEEHIALALDRVKHYKQAQQDMLKEGYKKVVRVFGRGE